MFNLNQESWQLEARSSIASVGILFYRDNKMKYKHRNFFFQSPGISARKNCLSNFHFCLWFSPSLQSWLLREKCHKGLWKLTQWEPQLFQIIPEGVAGSTVNATWHFSVTQSIDITKCGFQANTPPEMEQLLPSKLQGHFKTCKTPALSEAVLGRDEEKEWCSHLTEDG